jgi:hypothetical protein
MRLFVVVMVLGCAGCPMTGTYLGARTPPAGTLRVGAVVRADDVLKFTQGDLFVTYATSDDTNVHLRFLMTLGGELGMRWRFLHAGRLHLAIAPTATAQLWRRSYGDQEDGGTTGALGANVLARASLLATVELGDVDLNLAGFGGVYRGIPEGAPPGDAWAYAEWSYEMQGLISLGGAAAGVGFPLGAGELRPSIEWMRFATKHRNAGADDPAFSARDVWTFSIAWDR